MRAQAVRLRAAMADDQGVERAVAIINRYLEDHRKKAAR
jgi:hypothetical protein